MNWDNDIPVPTKAPKWDFEGAELGHSMGFETKEEAVKCSIAFKRWAQKNDKLWSTLVDTSFCSGWRMWIVEKRVRKLRIIRENVVQSDRMKASVLPFNIVHTHEIVAENVSTDTDDDIMLSTDTRRGGSVVIGKQPEARPIEVQGEVTATGRRRRKGKEG
jgi:hypothetical protein